MGIVVKTYGNNNGRTLDVNIFVRAEEKGNDQTTVEGDCWVTLYTAPLDSRIINVRPGGPSLLSETITKQGDISYPRGEGEIAKNFIVFSDRDGDDAEIYTRVEVDELEITLEKR